MGQRVKRVGHFRKVNGNRVWVKPTTYTQKDRGAPGRGREVLPRSPPGNLRGWKAAQTARVRHRILTTVAKADGEKATMARLQLVSTYNKRTAPKAAATARRDISWVASNFRGRVKVPAGTGRSRRKR